MFDHYDIAIQKVEANRARLMREAEMSRMAKAARDTRRAARPRTHERLLVILGELLIAGGTRLKARYAGDGHALSLPGYNTLTKARSPEQV